MAEEFRIKLSNSDLFKLSKLMTRYEDIDIMYIIDRIEDVLNVDGVNSYETLGYNGDVLVESDVPDEDCNNDATVMYTYFDYEEGKMKYQVVVGGDGEIRFEFDDLNKAVAYLKIASKFWKDDIDTIRG